jgi:hypothetical protein
VVFSLSFYWSQHKVSFSTDPQCDFLMDVHS